MIFDLSIYSHAPGVLLCLLLLLFIRAVSRVRLSACVLSVDFPSALPRLELFLGSCFLLSSRTACVCAYVRVLVFVVSGGDGGDVAGAAASPYSCA